MYIMAEKVDIVKVYPFNLIKVRFESGEESIVDRCVLTESPDYTPTISLSWFSK
jgi:hypothetical protein